MIRITRDSVLGGVNAKHQSLVVLMQNHSGDLDVVTHLRTRQKHCRCSAAVSFWWDIQECVHKTLKITKHSAHHLSKGGNCTSRLCCAGSIEELFGPKRLGWEKSQNILRNAYHIITTACPCEWHFCVHRGY